MTIHRRVYLVRHAQSANNALPESQRICDPGLTGLGHQQAERLAEWMKQLDSPQLFCSGFRRALETTAAIVRHTDWLPEIRADLFEQGGCYSGFPPNELLPEPGMGRIELQNQFAGWRIDDRISEQGWWYGQEYELEDSARCRASAVANWLSGKDLIGSREVILVIHADFKRLLIEQMFAGLRSMATWSCPYNASITSVVYIEDHWYLEYLNSVTHLPAKWMT